MSNTSDPTQTFRLCPRCGRAVPDSSGERFCSNDGEPLLESCPKCGAGIRTPLARFCTGCGFEFARASAFALTVMQAGVRVNRKKRGLKPTDPERTLERKEPS
jgi:predicted amidophosphoribosyltransferase